MELCSTSTGLLGIVIPLIIAAIWGIGDGIFNTQLSALIALLFKHDMVLVIIFATVNSFA